MASKSKSAADRQKIVEKLCKLLKKEFGGAPKRDPLPVLETMVYAILLENASHEDAQVAFDRLKNDFFDWNEVRVSTIAELEPVFDGLSDPARRAMRVRYILYYVFDHHYSYDFDGIKKKTLELAQKQLAKIKHLTPYARNYLLQRCLGSHIIPADDQIIQLAMWLGMLPLDSTPDSGAEAMKSFVRKSDGIEFAWLLKAVASSKFAIPILEDPSILKDEELCSIESAESRLGDLFSGKIARSHSAKKAAETRKTAAAAEAAQAKKADNAKKVKTSKPAHSKVTETETENGDGAPEKKVVKKKTERPSNKTVVTKKKTTKKAPGK
jgi:hypothetical protein